MSSDIDLSSRPRLTDIDYKLFTHPVPAEGSGWQRPGRAVMRLGAITLPSAVPELDQRLLSPTPVEFVYSNSNGVADLIPPPAADASVGLGHRPLCLPTNYYPISTETAMHGQRNVPQAQYFLHRTNGPKIDYPLEKAGPIANRNIGNPPPVSVSNTFGNLRVHVVSTNCIQVWVLGRSDQNLPTWLVAQEGMPHPDLRQIVLSYAVPIQPEWIKEASYKSQKAKEKKKAKAERVE